MPVLVPLLAEMGINAAVISAAVLTARVALFWYSFIKQRAL